MDQVELVALTGHLASQLLLAVSVLLAVLLGRKALEYFYLLGGELVVEEAADVGDVAVPLAEVGQRGLSFLEGCFEPGDGHFEGADLVVLVVEDC